MNHLLEFKTWFHNTNEGTVNAEKNYLNILRSAFGLRGIDSDSELKEISLKDIKTPTFSTPKGIEVETGAKKIIKDQQFYKSLEQDDPKKVALDNLDTSKATVGTVVDILTRD
jgi:uncharacterized protein YwbE